MDICHHNEDTLLASIKEAWAGYIADLAKEERENVVYIDANLLPSNRWRARALKGEAYFEKLFGRPSGVDPLDPYDALKGEGHDGF